MPKSLPIRPLTKMLMNTLYIDVDNIILDICNIANEDQSMINNLHILEECGVSTNRYFGGVWGVNKPYKNTYTTRLSLTKTHIPPDLALQKYIYHQT
jgi:hypothetical protein